MRVVAAIPAFALLAGCAAGLCWPDVSRALLIILIGAGTSGGLSALRSGRAVLLTVAVTAGFAAGAALLAADAWHRAWRPPLRIAFESIARDERLEALRSGRLLPEDDTATVNLIGVLRQDASPGANGVSLSVRVTWIGRARSASDRLDPAINPTAGGVLLTVIGSLAAERMAEWRSGRTIRTSAVLRRPARYLDPGVPDQERALARRGTTLVGTVKSGALVDLIERGSAVAESAASVRAYARRAIAEAVGRWSRQSAGIVTAIVIGDRTGLDDEIERKLQEAGTYHVIAISGGNIAILAGLTLAVFRIAGLLGRAAMLSAIGGLIAYGYLVGGGASVDRATLMAVVYFLGRAIDLRGPPLNSLALVAGILVVSDPLAVADPAFLLTFGATAAILFSIAALPVRGLRRLHAMVMVMFVASAAAEAALMPIAATIFSRVTFAGLVLNFAAIPLMAVVQIAGMAIVPLFAVSVRMASILGWIAHFGADGLVRTAGLVRFAPAVTWRVVPASTPAIGGYYAGAIMSCALWRWRAVALGSREPPSLRALRFAGLAAALLSALWILAEPWTVLPNRGDGRLHVTFIDVGQGDSAFVRLPHGGAFVIDAGGLGGKASFDVGDRVVAPVLRASGVRRLGTLALTHGDADHIGGAMALVNEFRPWEIWEGVPVPPFEPLRLLKLAARDRRLRWANVQANDVVAVDDVAVVVRHPDWPDWERQDVRNDDSIVIELLWRDVSFVFTGDIGREVERKIADRFQASPLRVLKVPHHGSLTSSSASFVRVLAPTVAVVSVGRSNNFGHPAPAVIQRYRDAGAEVFRTDQDGAVTIGTDGTALQIQTFTGRTVHIGRSAVHHEVTRNTKDTK